MTLLNATSAVIDVIKEHSLDDDEHVRNAVKRLEKRLFVLQLRHTKRQKQNRWKAFRQAIQMFGGGALHTKDGLRDCVICQKCRHGIEFDDFIENATFNGNGRIITLVCPHCSVNMENSPTSKLYLSAECNPDQLSGTSQSGSSQPTPWLVSHRLKTQTSVSASL